MLMSYDEFVSLKLFYARLTITWNNMLEELTLTLNNKVHVIQIDSFVIVPIVVISSFWDYGVVIHSLLSFNQVGTIMSVELI